MTDFYVSNQSELESALSSAQGGDTIVLKDGNYGSIDFTGTFDAEVTIRSENPLGAVFDEFTMTNCSNLTFEEITVNSFNAYTSQNIELHDSDVNSIVYLRDVNGVTIVGNDIDGGLHAMLLNDVQNFTVANNKIHTAQEDLMRVTGNSYNGLIEGNYFFDTHPEDYRDEGGEYNHSDFIQMFGVDGYTPHDITISRNVMYDDPTTGASTVTPQGIFLSDPHTGGYQNILIEENLISVRSTNSIYINGGQENVVVQNNTLMANNGGGGIIRLAEKAGLDNSGTTVIGNVMKYLDDETGSSTIGSNYIYDYGTDLSKVFQGDGSSWEGFLPVEGSEYDLSGMGAIGFLTDLLAGESWWQGGTTDQQPSPTPTPEPEPTPEPNPDDDASITPVEGTVFAMTGTKVIASSSDVVEVAPDASLELSTATITLNFNADSVSGSHGLVSRDASFFEGGGHHFTSYISNGVLYVRVQDGITSQTIEFSGIQAGTDYNLQMAFDDGSMSVWLDGALIGTVETDMSWLTNGEYLQIGANGWASASGDSGFQDVFDGTISDVMIVEGAMSPAELATYLEAASEPSPTPTPDPEPTPEPNPDDDASITPVEGTVFAMTGTKVIASSSDVVEVAPGGDLALPAATIALTFNADTVTGSHGIVSKDASFFEGGGHHFTSYINDGVLVVRAQDGITSQTVEIPGIQAGTDYSLQIAFGDGSMSVFLDGSLIDTVATNMSWETNGEYLQIGANGWSSASGESGFQDVFDGTISNVMIVEGAMSPEELVTFLETGTVVDTENNAVISGTTTGTVIEDNLLSTGGKLDVSDPDAGQAAFVSQSGTAGVYGAFTLEADGSWHYTLDNEQAAVQALTSGVELTDTLLVSTLDGTAQQITVTINGTDDTAIISGTTAGSVTEDNPLSTGGKLNVSDPDAGQAAFVPQSGAAGSYGAFSVQADGTWSYLLDNDQEAVQALDTGDQVTDTLTVSTLDGTTQQITVTINGLDEDVADTPAPVFSILGSSEFSGSRSDILNLNHDSSFEINEGTIAFSFEADTVKGGAGLVSKDAHEYEGGGNHFSVWIKGGNLFVRFQDEDSDATFAVRDIEANREYDLVANFDADGVEFYLDGALIGSDELVMDWTLNGQNLQIGGLGWRSSDGGDHTTFGFDGTISDFHIFDEALTPDQFDLVA